MNTPNSPAVASGTNDSYTLHHRVLKFRAWDSTQMIDVEKLEYLTPEKSVSKKPAYNVNDHLGIPLFYLMQFTGLHDKNGVEIYDGDIVKLSKYINGIGSIGVVKYAEKWAQFYLSTRNKHDVGIAFTNTHQWYYDDNGNASCEVIGNIFEHPELLKRV